VSSERSPGGKHTERRGGVVPLGDAIHAFLKESGVRATPKHTRVFSAWSKNLTEAESTRATPVKFFRGTLTVEVESGVYMYELKNIKNEKYRTQANATLGEQLISKVSYRLKG